MKNKITLKVSSFVILVALLMASCAKDDPIEISTTPSAGQSQEQFDDSIIQVYLSDNNITATKHHSGIYYVVQTSGGNQKPNVQSTISIAYQGYRMNGDVFDSTNGSITTFSLSNLIEGWQFGIPLIGEGGAIKLIIPSKLGYGEYSAGSIPPNSILIFDISLHSFR